MKILSKSILNFAAEKQLIFHLIKLIILLFWWQDDKKKIILYLMCPHIEQIIFYKLNILKKKFFFNKCYSIL